MQTAAPWCDGQTPPFFECGPEFKSLVTRSTLTRMLLQGSIAMQAMSMIEQILNPRFELFTVHALHPRSHAALVGNSLNHFALDEPRS